MSGLFDLLVSGFAIALGVAGSSTAVPPQQDGAGVSTPRTDSVYPAYGDAGVDTLHYGLRLTWHRGTRTLDGTAAIRLRALSDGAVRLDLDHRLRVRTVSLRRSGRALAVTSAHPGDDLVVRSPRLASGTTYTLRVAYRGRPGPVHAPTSRTDTETVGMHVTPDGQLWTMQEPYGASTWYPVNDQPADKATYDLTVDVPRPWVGVGNGRLVSRRVVGDRQVTRFHSRDPMSSYLTTLAVGPYRRVTQRGPHGLPLSYWVPRDHPEYLRPLRRTPEALAWLERLLGPYPFDRAGLVVVPSSSGMETQTMITLGRTIFRFGGPYVRETVLHELAHAWYGDTVTPDDWRDVWMNEGMAMYLEARWTVDQGRQTWQQWETVFDAQDGMLRRSYGPPGAYDPQEFAQTNVYFCPARMWLALRDRLGAQRFDTLIRRWPQEHRNTAQDRWTYTSWWGAEAGVGWAWFEPWLLSKTSPD